MKITPIKLYKDTPLLEKYSHIIGIDEVGRGCWAGPVMVGAFVITPDTVFINGVNDSKLVTSKNRKKISAELKQNGIYKIAKATPKEIDKFGIGKTIAMLIESLINELSVTYNENALFIVDGQFSQNFGNNVVKENKADTNYYCVGAASILAKEERDQYMEKISLDFPEYAFEKHKGYGTKLHSEALNMHGPTSIHRFSYKPVHSISKKVL